MITIKEIKNTLERELDIADLSIRSRKQHIVYGRYLGYKLCKKFTANGATSIGLEFGRDHASVLHGLKKFNVFKHQRFFKKYLELYMDLFKLFEPKKSAESLKFYLEHAVSDILLEKQKNPEIDYSFLTKSINDLTLVND